MGRAFKIQDYALWEVIENGDSWVLISHTTEENGITTLKISTPATAKEKIKRKNYVKARGLLLMALLNEHQLTFSQYPDAKSMFAAIETRFGGGCYNWHKLGHFARSAGIKKQKISLRNQDKHQEVGRKRRPSKVMLAIDGCRFLIGVTWQEELVQTNMALMTFSDSEVFTDKTCSKTFLNNYETLKKQYDDLLAKQLQTKFESATYTRGLDTVEAQLVTYRKNEQEKYAFDFKIEKFDKASKDLDQLLESQIPDKSKKGLGYSAVPPPHPLIYNIPNKLDLSYSGLNECKEPKFKGYGLENSKKESNVDCEKESDNSKDNSDKSLVKEQDSQVLDDEEQDESMTKPAKKTVIPTAAKIEKLIKRSVRHIVVTTALVNRTSVNDARAKLGSMLLSLSMLGQAKHDDKGLMIVDAQGN
ncbi:hypothetical protein Tco_1576736 [Tanacetum coccineum]